MVGDSEHGIAPPPELQEHGIPVGNPVIPCPVAEIWATESIHGRHTARFPRNHAQIFCSGMDCSAISEAVKTDTAGLLQKIINSIGGGTIIENQRRKSLDVAIIELAKIRLILAHQKNVFAFATHQVFLAGKRLPGKSQLRRFRAWPDENARSAGFHPGCNGKTGAGHPLDGMLQFTCRKTCGTCRTISENNDSIRFPVLHQSYFSACTCCGKQSRQSGKQCQ